MEDADMIHDDQFDELVEITDECQLTSLVSNQLLDEVPAPIQSEIQSIFTNTPVDEFHYC